MPPDAKKQFTDTITSWREARQASSDESGPHRQLGDHPEYVTREEYERDMHALEQGLTMLVAWQNQVWGAAKALAGLLTLVLGLLEIWRQFHK